jgi:hypothetical protein
MRRLNVQTACPLALQVLEYACKALEAPDPQALWIAFSTLDAAEPQMVPRSAGLGWSLSDVSRSVMVFSVADCSSAYPTTESKQPGVSAATKPHRARSARKTVDLGKCMVVVKFVIGVYRVAINVQGSRVDGLETLGKE